MSFEVGDVLYCTPLHCTIRVISNSSAYEDGNPDCWPDGTYKATVM